jgi:RNA polymerase sigma-70 factor (ECF subfamily)
LTAQPLIEHFFRHQYARLVALLTRRVGVHEIVAVEDAAQFALMRALEIWTNNGVPENPSAWVYQVARNKLLDELRQRSGRERLLNEHAPELVPTPDLALDRSLGGELSDELLRMLFVCSDDSIPRESQLVLALKTLCGFDVREIAIRLFTSEANVYKRLGRARKRLQLGGTDITDLSPIHYPLRLPAVCQMLYLLFTEGYLSSQGEISTRLELCEEAIRLTTLLAEHPAGQDSSVAALLALMHLQMARMRGRTDGSGGLLLLEEQDRKQWDFHQIQLGLAWLEKSAVGELFSRYHAEASIAAEHCLAPRFVDTRWDRIVDSYALLEKTNDSPIHRLNRAVATAELEGPEAGLAVLAESEPPSWLMGSYLWSAVKADLLLRSGKLEEAKRYRECALSDVPSQAIRDLLRRRLDPSRS